MPGRNEKWKETTISNTSQLQFDQEFGNTFFGTGDTLINSQTLMEMRAEQPKEIYENGHLLLYQKPEENHEYIMCIDVAKGRGQDYSTFNLVDISVRPFRQVAVYRNNTISPILFPNIIYKWANVYNKAYVVIESNDQGSVVCNGLYQDLEYENIHAESAIRMDKIGVEITRKTKRMGCSAIKDLLENNKLTIVDENTIFEASTFVSRGQSYEASDGNHDDLIMNLVLFGYFVTSKYFGDMTDINLKEMIFKQKMKEIDDDIVPFGHIDDGSQFVEEEVKKPDWVVEFDHDQDFNNYSNF